MSKKTQHTKQFKLDAVQYRKEHPELTHIEYVKNLGIGSNTLACWETQYRNNSGDIPTRGSGNHSSEEQKEIARLNRELRDAQDALDVLKKPSAFWATTDRSCLHRSFYQGRGCQSRPSPCLYLWNAEILRRVPLRLLCLSSQKDICKAATQGICQRADTNDL